MESNDFLRAIRQKLKALYPEKEVFTGEIPRQADGNFYLRLLESGQEKGLGRRRKRSLKFELLYYATERDTVAFQQWAERMYEAFERLTVEGAGQVRSIALKNQKARDNENTAMFQFLFDAEFDLLFAAEPLPLMEGLELTERTESR